MRTQTFSTLSGILGALSGLGGVFLYLIAPEWRWTITAFAAVGVLLLLFFFVTHFETVKTFSSRRSTKFGTNSFLMVVIFLGILGIVDFILNQHYGRIDLSEGGTYSLSPQTVNVLKGLKEEVKVSGFYKERSTTQAQAKDLFESYRYYSPKFNYDFVDPDKNPALAKLYGITEYDTVVVEAAGKPGGAGATKEAAKGVLQGATSSQTGPDVAEPKKGALTVSIRKVSEQELTGAIVRVTRSTKKVIYFTEGHGEHSIDDAARPGYSEGKSGLQKQGYSVKKLLLLSDPKVPDDAAVLVIAGPQKPFLDQEIGAVETYLKRGGQLFALIDPQARSGLEGLLNRYGVELKNDIVYDPFSRLFGGEFNIPIVNPGMYARHELTKDFNLPTFYPLVRSVSANKEKGSIFVFQDVVKTGPTSWATPKVGGPPENFNPNRDQKGPVTIGAVVTVKKDASGLSDAEKKMRLAVLGDSDFATNIYFDKAGNGDLFQNVVSWLAQEEDLISIRPKEAKTSTLMLTTQQGKFLFYVPVVALPGAVLITGFTIWRRRRRL